MYSYAPTAPSGVGGPVWLSTEVGMMMGEGNKLCIRAEPLAKGRFLTTAGKHRREAAVNIWERGGAKGEVAGRWWLSRQPVKGRGQSTRLASLGAFQATELPFSSTKPPCRDCRRSPPVADHCQLSGASGQAASTARPQRWAGEATCCTQNNSTTQHAQAPRPQPVASVPSQTPVSACGAHENGNPLVPGRPQSNRKSSKRARGAS